MKDDYLRQIFEKCVAAIVGSHNVRMDKATFQYIVYLAELRMQQTFSDLAQLARLQRRVSPSTGDLMLWMTRNNIDLVDFQMPQGPTLDALNSLKFSFDLEQVTPESEVFFNPQLFQIKNIVQSREALPSYAPEWSPALPPDHTFMASADYPNKVRALQDLHEKLFSEGHQAELALQGLLGSNGSASAISLGFPGRDSERERVGVGHEPATEPEDVDMDEPMDAKPEAPEDLVPVKAEATEQVEELPELQTTEQVEEPELQATEQVEEPELQATEQVEEPELQATEQVEEPELQATEPGTTELQATAPEEPAPTTPEEPTSTAPEEPTTTAPKEPSPTPQTAPLKLGFKLSLKPPAQSPAQSPARAPSPEPAPSYITVVPSEPAPPKEKPLNLKISLRKPRSKASARPKIDIVELAQQHAQLAQRQQAQSQPQDLAALLHAALESSKV